MNGLPFLLIETDPAAVALGKAGKVHTETPLSTLFNPVAGKGNKIQFAHIFWMEGSYIESAGASWSLRNFTVAGTLNALLTSPIPYTVNSPEETGYFSYRAIWTSLSYSQDLTILGKLFRIGATLKLAYHGFLDYVSTGLAVDLGAALNFEKRKHKIYIEKLVVTVNNIGYVFAESSFTNTGVQIGGVVKLPGFKYLTNGSLSASVSVFNQRAISPKIGVEYTIFNIVKPRIGFKYEGCGTAFVSFGFGLVYKKIGFDLCVLPLGYAGYAFYFGLQYAFK